MEDFSNPIMCNAIELSNGNYIISWSIIYLGLFTNLFMGLIYLIIPFYLRKLIKVSEVKISETTKTIINLFIVFIAACGIAHIISAFSPLHGVNNFLNLGIIYYIIEYIWIFISGIVSLTALIFIRKGIINLIESYKNEVSFYDNLKKQTKLKNDLIKDLKYENSELKKEITILKAEQSIE